MYNVSDTCQVKGLDLIYSKYFGFDYKGIFVEVGAFDGESFSNTSCLADSGWRGIYIEPIKSHCDMCIERHKNNNVSVIQCSIGTEENEKDIYILDGGLTTTKLEQVQMFSEMGWSRNYVESKCRQFRLDRIFSDLNIGPNFDVLVVDVEGNEEDVFNSFDLDYWYPKMIIAELIDEHNSFQKYDSYIETNRKLRNKIIESNYAEIYKDDINTIFVSKDLFYRIM